MSRRRGGIAAAWAMEAAPAGRPLGRGLLRPAGGRGRRRAWKPILLCLLAPGLAGAQPTLPEELTLTEAVEFARLHSPVLKEIRQRMDFQDGVVKETRSAGLPQVSVVGGYTQFDENRQQSFGADMAPDDSQWNMDAEVSNIIYSGGRNRMAIDSELDRKAAVAAELEAASEDILAAVHEAYYDALLARETAEVQREAVAVLREQLASARNRLEAGTGARFDVTQAEVAVANAHLPLVRAENDYRRRIDDLRRQIGLPFPPGKDAGDIRLARAPAPEELDLELDTALAVAAERRPELTDVARRLQAARRDIKRAAKQNRPLLEAFVDYGVENDQFGEEDELHGWTAGVRLTWDLFTSGGRRGRIEQRAAEMRAIRYEQDQLRLQIGSEVRQAFYDYQEARGILQVTRLVIEQAEEALQLARNRYEAGRGTQLDVLESELQLTRSRLEDTTSLNNLRRAVVRIKRAIGAPL